MAIYPHKSPNQCDFYKKLPRQDTSHRWLNVGCTDYWLPPFELNVQWVSGGVEMESGAERAKRYGKEAEK